MSFRGPLLLLVLALVIAGDRAVLSQDLPAIPPIKRLLPPPGIEVPEEVRKELEAKLAELAPRLEKLRAQLLEMEDQWNYCPDIEVFTKAVAFALRFNEFYDQKDFDKARWAIKQAEERLSFAEKGEHPWARQTGLVVRGYYSSIDGSVQPYGLVIPDKHDFEKECPLYVFLHGRGDKETDLHFIYGRARSKGEIVPENAIVVHPFGRQCIGFKSAGEIDVLEASTDVELQYKTLPKAALVGFSMGGAGAWHLGAHYPDRWSVVSPGAGFVDVARYQRLKPANYPPLYEQKLWGIYDVPAYTRNLFNVPVIAYSGELDKQKDAADCMAEAFQKEGRKLTHLVGPGTEHKYHPETKRELLKRLNEFVRAKPATPTEFHIQSRNLRYGEGRIARLEELIALWEDARLDGRVVDDHWEIATKNVRRFHADTRELQKHKSIVIDGQRIELVRSGMSTKREQLPEDAPRRYAFRKTGDAWSQVLTETHSALKKTAAQEGPIDEAFLAKFLVVTPTKPAWNPRVQQWTDFELAHFKERWEATFRGRLRIITADEMLVDEPGYLHDYNVIVWGDPGSNPYLAKCLKALPLTWTRERLSIAGVDYDAAKHVPLMIYPLPGSRGGSLVLNSGPTFREAHDRTNSLQNPKLPDWAIIDITTPPDGEKPGKVVAADFFDEQWQVKKGK